MNHECDLVRIVIVELQIVELRPSGEYRIVDGELAIAVVQRIGFLEIGVVNTDREYETTEEIELEQPTGV